MNRKNNYYTGLFAYALLLFVTTAAIAKQKGTYWNWRNIDPQEVSFPETFLWGTATDAYEIEGNCNVHQIESNPVGNTWYLWKKGKNTTSGPWDHGSTCDHWRRYKEDIQKMSQLGLKSYCFSIEWSRVEPYEGIFSEDAMQHYHNICDELVRNGIKPVVILKGYCDPIWFSYKGGFEKEKNISHFVRFCEKIFSHLRDNVDIWITFRSPEMYALNGYFRGTIPPEKTSIQSMITVLKNMLEAHVQVYRSCKKLDRTKTIKKNANSTLQIGITKQIYPLEPWNIANPLDHTACWIANKLLNESVYDFFTTGIFSVKIPLIGLYKASITHQNAYAPKALDFIGINYFSHGYMNNFRLTANYNEMQTDIDKFSIYPEGLYFAIKQVAENIAQKLDIPLYITQNGLATTDASTQDLFIKRHIYALSQAINDGFDVRGYFYWTFMDCYSWGSHENKMGLLTKERELKEGAQYFIDLISKTRKN